MLQFKVLIIKLLAVDAFTSSTVASSEVTTLDHERLDYTVEGGALEV